MFAPDLALLTWVVAHRTSWATKFSNLLMSASSNQPMIVAVFLLAATLVVVRRRWAVAIVVGLAAVTSVAVTGALKVLVGRHRPPDGLALVHATGFSMPSTDGALTAAVASSLFLITAWPTPHARRAGAAGLGVGVVLIGACLVYLGAHWPSDVLAGWVVGALAAWTCYRVQQWIFRPRLAPHRPRSSPSPTAAPSRPPLN